MSQQEARNAHLQTLLAKREATDHIVAGARQVAAGGVDGVRAIALSDPELILLVITSMADIIADQEKAYAQIIEDYYELSDASNSLTDTIKKGLGL